MRIFQVNANAYMLFSGRWYVSIILDQTDDVTEGMWLCLTKECPKNDGTQAFNGFQTAIDFAIEYLEQKAR